MAKVMPVILYEGGPLIGCIITCPACDCGHMFHVDKWTFNGNIDKPTFRPSMLVRGVRYPSGGQFPTEEETARMLAGESLNMQSYVCHSFITDGKIQFLGDCTHSLVGQTVNLPEV